MSTSTPNHMAPAAVGAAKLRALRPKSPVRLRTLVVGFFALYGAFTLCGPAVLEAKTAIEERYAPTTQIQLVPVTEAGTGQAPATP